MLVTMLTAIYMMVRVAEQLGIRWVRQPEPLPYMVSQPLPWQVHNVSQGRRRSRTEESEGHRRNSIGVYRKKSSSPDKAASTIQNQYRKYQQKKQKDHK
ncbi:uncharacterized protein LOC127421917 isoform X2 [Myxocyprinus asiaticus]|uniref:uncharacterized protein LOC127421917 isoform X2 n=1 Tax=Myxocyprinus asiaticus TaxID=70543 RepID=UPI002221F43D|nr:uncharacterized protein LOC127421917 isoform X2 [Myxocyprinus asiaticus]